MLLRFFYFYFFIVMLVVVDITDVFILVFLRAFLRVVVAFARVALAT